MAHCIVLTVGHLKYSWGLYKNRVQQSCLDRLTESDGLAYWQNWLFSYIILYITPISLVAAIPGFIMSIIGGVYGLAVLNVVIVLYYGLLALHSGIPVLVKKWLFIAGLYAVVVVVLYYLGAFGPALLYLLTISVFCTFIFSHPVAALSVLFNALVCALYAIMLHLELVYTANYPVYSVGSWIAVASNGVFLSGVIAFVGPRVLKKLGNAFVQQQKLRKEMLEQKLHLAKKELQYRTITNSTRDLMWSTDEAFNLTFMNAAFQNNIQQTNGEPLKLGQNVLTDIEMPFKYGNRGHMYQKVRAGQTIETVLQTTHDKPIWYQIALYPMLSEGNILGVAGFARDITDLKKKELAITHMMKDLERQNHHLQQFGYIVSHNLRGPVANIVGITDLFSNANTSAEMQSKLIDGLTKSADKLDKVIHDLDGIVKMKSGDGQDKELLNLDLLVDEVLETIHPKLLQHDVEIVKEIHAQRPIFGAKSYMTSVLYNLITNGLKYRHQSQNCVITIRVKQDATSTQIQVADNGLGIDLEKKGSEVFGLYKRFHQHQTGRGLGLYMVKTQTEAMGGEISIESQVDVGTTFTISLPLG